MSSTDMAKFSGETTEGSTESPWVLFVDDEPLVLSSYRRALSSHLNVGTANSGVAALALIASSSPPAVVVVDQQMPEMTGIDLLLKLREVSPDSVRIMLTGQADLATAIQAVNQGQVFRFLTKPVDAIALQQVVAESMQFFVERTEEKRLFAEAMAGRQADVPEVEASAMAQLLQAKLTSRELDVLRLIGQGNSSKDIGLKLGISHRTVDVHRSHILEKLNLHNSTSLVRIAIMAGLL